MFITVLILIVGHGGTSLGSGENKILTPRASLKSDTSHTDTDSANSLYPVLKLDDTYSAAGELRAKIQTSLECLRCLNACITSCASLI